MRVKESQNQVIVILERGEEIQSSLKEFARENDFFGFFKGIGAVSNPRIGYFNREKGEYVERQLDGEFEVLSLLGNISRNNDKIAVHSHITLGNKEYNVKGGHLVQANVSVTLEILLQKCSQFHRKKDEETGLQLIKEL